MGLELIDMPHVSFAYALPHYGSSDVTNDDNSPVSQRFSPSGEQPEHRILAHELWQLTAGCIEISHKYCWYTKRVGITTTLTLRNDWGMLLMCQNTTMRVYGARIKDITFYVQKHTEPLAMCYNTTLVSDKLLGAPASVKLVYYDNILFQCPWLCRNM